MVVGAYATVRFPRELYQTDPLIIADGLNVNTDGPGKLAYAHLCGLEDAIDEKRRTSIESWRFQIQDTRHSLVGTRESEDLRILIKVAEKGNPYRGPRPADTIIITGIDCRRFRGILAPDRVRDDHCRMSSQVRDGQLRR